MRLSSTAGAETGSHERLKTMFKFAASALFRAGFVAWATAWLCCAAVVIGAR